MDMKIETIIFLLFIFTCLGVALGAFIQREQYRRSNSQKGLQQPTVENPAAMPIENQSTSSEAVEILRALRAKSGALWLEMDGNRYDSRESFKTDQRKRLVNLLLELRPWLENTSIPTPVSPDRPRIDPSPVFSLRKDKPQKEEVKPVLVIKSIVHQIDDVLQEKLPSSTFLNRDIHLEEGPGGVVMVRDGLKKYEGIEAVPDPEIQVLIRQAVSDWEKGSTR
jgi:hypothetical protein